MKKIGIFLTLTFGCTLPAAAECLISPNGIGDVSLGQNLKQVRQKFPKAKFKRESDAEGAAFVDITLSKDITVSAHLNGDDDPDAPLRLNKKIIWLGTSSPACRTASGIRPGMKIQDAEAKLGKLKRISLSEIEMRETAEFSRMPKQMTFRVESGAGIYADHSVCPCGNAPVILFSGLRQLTHAESRYMADQYRHDPSDDGNSLFSVRLLDCRCHDCP